MKIGMDMYKRNDLRVPATRNNKNDFSGQSDGRKVEHRRKIDGGREGRRVENGAVPRIVEWKNKH